MACSGMALGGAIGYAGKILIHGEKSNDVPTVLQKFQKAGAIDNNLPFYRLIAGTICCVAIDFQIL